MLKVRFASRDSWVWFAVLAFLVFCGESLGYAACLVVEMLPPHPVAMLAFATVAVVVGGVAAILLDWHVLDSMRHTMAENSALRLEAERGRIAEALVTQQQEHQRRLRHDLRGALSPALLTADRLLNHDDPAVKRTGSIIVRCVERATSLISDPAKASEEG